ncbi:MAG: TonB-dependent receptor [Verrucomicrobiota bacterium]|nr:TonB-dependent receptor [Verrucomicrobiota bacterium]
MKRSVFIILYLISTNIYAQTSPPVAPTLVVSVSGEKKSLTVPSPKSARQELRRVPGGVSLIVAKDYQKGRNSTIKDALDFAPGVIVQPRQGSEESRISIRGSGIQRTFHGRGLKLLQDDVPLNQTDGGFDFQAIEPLATQYIEIYRGANALEYGATTLGGAVNFISPTGYSASKFQSRFEVGSFDYLRGQLSSGMRAGSVDAYASVTHFSQDGFRDHSNQNNQKVFANVGYRPDENLENRFYVGYVTTDSQLAGSLTKAQMYANPTQAQRNPFFSAGDVVTSQWKRDFDLIRLSDKLTVKGEEQTLELKGFWAYKDLSHPIVIVIDQESSDFGLDLKYTNKKTLFGNKNRVVAGLMPTIGIMQDTRFLNALGARGAQIYKKEQTSGNLDFYVQDEHYVSENLALIAGTQISYATREQQDEFPAAGYSHQDYLGFSPKIGAIFEINPMIQVFGNLSRSFEPPSFGELSKFAFGGVSGTGLNRLDAQTGNTIEVGSRGKEGRFTWDAVYYYSKLEDELIGFQIASGVSATQNASDTVHQGVELGLDVEVLSGLLDQNAEKPDRVLMRQTYTLSHFAFDGDPQFGNKLIAGIPQHYYRAELRYEHASGFYIGPNIEWVPVDFYIDHANTLTNPAYFLVGIRTGYEFSNGLSLFFEGRNLFDEIYSATPGVIANAGGVDSAQYNPGDGRAFYGGAGFKW